MTSPDGEQRASWRRLVWQRPLPMLIALRTAMGFVEFGANDVMPLYLCAAVRYGGLGLSVRRQGLVTTYRTLPYLTLPYLYPT